MNKEKLLKTIDDFGQACFDDDEGWHNVWSQGNDKLYYRRVYCCISYDINNSTVGDYLEYKT